MERKFERLANHIVIVGYRSLGAAHCIKATMCALGTCMGAWLFAYPWLRHSPWSVGYSKYFELFADC